VGQGAVGSKKYEVGSLWRKFLVPHLRFFKAAAGEAGSEVRVTSYMLHVTGYRLLVLNLNLNLSLNLLLVPGSQFPVSSYGSGPKHLNNSTTQRKREQGAGNGEQ